MACLIVKYWIGQMDFYSLTLDGSTICNQFESDSDQSLGWHLIYTPCLIYKHYSNSSFKVIWRRGLIGMIITRLRHIVWCQYNEIDQRKIRNGGEKSWKMKLTTHILAGRGQSSRDWITCNPWSTGPVTTTLQTISSSCSPAINNIIHIYY